MRAIKTVGVKDLKNNLSAYLREVKLGARILVTERNSVIAELREPLSGDLSAVNSLREQWIRDGRIRPALSAKIPCSPSPIQSPSGTSQRLINEDRGP